MPTRINRHRHSVPKVYVVTEMDGGYPSVDVLSVAKEDLKVGGWDLLLITNQSFLPTVNASLAGAKSRELPFNMTVRLGNFKVFATRDAQSAESVRIAGFPAYDPTSN